MKYREVYGPIKFEEIVIFMIKLIIVRGVISMLRLSRGPKTLNSRSRITSIVLFANAKRSIDGLFNEK